MSSFVFSGQPYSFEAGETVLSCLLRHGAKASNSCRSGVCQSCMVKASGGTIPAVAQAGLKAAHKAQGCLLACVCPAGEDLVLEPTDALASHEARVEAVEPLARNVYRAFIRVDASFTFEPGQFVQLVRPHDELVRPYSIANLHGEGRLELHIAELPGGQMSGWLRRAAGERVIVRGPAGECFYVPGRPDEPLLLAGTGTGLAPLLGVMRAALSHDHRAPIGLYHGSPAIGGLYMYRELRELEASHPNLRFVASVLEHDDPTVQAHAEPLDQLVLREHGACTGYRAFLCGHPELVRTLRKKIFLAGAAMQDIHSDPFVLAPR